MKNYNKEDLKVITQDPRFHIIEDIIRDYIEPLKDISKIDLNDEASVVKAEIKVRKDMVSQLEKMLHDIGLLKTVLSRQPGSFK